MDRTGTMGAEGGVTATLTRSAQDTPEALAALCATYNATYDTYRDAQDGQRVVRLHLANGDVVSGRGATGASAVDNLKARVEALSL